MARKPRAFAAITPPLLPPKPAPSQREIEANERILRQLQELNVQLEQRCLDRAVALAQQAARRRGPLVGHFMELGRRYLETKDAPELPTLRILKGGAA